MIGRTEKNQEKQELRRRYRMLRRGVAPEARPEADAEIRRRIRALPAYLAAVKVAIYAGDASEPDLLPLMNDDPDKEFFLPRYVPGAGAYELAKVGDARTELAPGRFNLLEPVSSCPAASRADVRRGMLFCIPGVAFDDCGVRLGRGGGYYDRLLADTEGTVVGVFYAVQHAENLPETEHDRRLDLAVTEKEVLFFGKGL